jgi:hypothetical protein
MAACAIDGIMGMFDEEKISRTESIALIIVAELEDIICCFTPLLQIPSSVDRHSLIWKPPHVMRVDLIMW